MRTPRELLLHRHRTVESALDQVRRDALRALPGRSLAQARVGAIRVDTFLGALWQEFFVACRRYWMSLGAAWCAIVILVLAGASDDSSRAMATSVPSEPVIQAMREQERLRAELLGVSVTEGARAAGRDPAPGPHSEGIAAFANG